MKDKQHNDDNNDGTSDPRVGLHGHAAALQVICLGHSGGPSEENVSGFLVRSVNSNWAKGSLLAVDAGSHLAPIVRILEKDFPLVSRDRTRSSFNGDRGSSIHKPQSDGERNPPHALGPLSSGPFAGLALPHESARANALHLLRNYISTYLITHPHLDHISGFAINTAAFHATSRPKTLAALPSTVDAIKQHIFNDVIWPNLSDEDGGVGFVTFQRLKEGGDVMLGEGEGRGYIDVCDGLGVKAFKVSHGVCTKSPPSHRHRGSLSGPDAVGSHGLAEAARTLSQYSTPGTPGIGVRAGFFPGQPSPQYVAGEQAPCVVDSTSFFVRDGETQREVLIFGDVEPDTISLSPRNRLVWEEAARKIVHGLLGGIFIESSYDNSQGDAVLFGHLNPKHLMAELQVLAGLVTEADTQRLLEMGAKKRKRSAPQGSPETGFSFMAETSGLRSKSESLENKSNPAYDARRHMDVQEVKLSANSSNEVPRASWRQVWAQGGNRGQGLPLAGIKVVIIHVKDTLKDGPHVSQTIRAQLLEIEQELRDEGRGLGCDFVLAQSGESYWF